MTKLKNPAPIDDFTEIFVDGSASQKRKGSAEEIAKKSAMGSAWLIAAPNKPIYFNSMKIKLQAGDPDMPQKRMALFAEFAAAASALMQAEKNSKIRLYTDRRDMAELLTDFEGWRNVALNERANRPRTMKMAELLYQSTLRHQIVIAEVLSDKDTHDYHRSSMMTVAHNMSAQKSGSRNIKEIRDKSILIGIGLDPFIFDPPNDTALEQGTRPPQFGNKHFKP